MKAKYLFSTLFVLTLTVSAHVQANGIAFVTDVKGEAVMDAGKATLMAEVKKGARISCSKDCAVGVMYLISGKEYVLKGPGDFLVGDSEVTAKIGPPQSGRLSGSAGRRQVACVANQAARRALPSLRNPTNDHGATKARRQGLIWVSRKF